MPGFGNILKKGIFSAFLQENILVLSSLSISNLDNYDRHDSFQVFFVPQTGKATNYPVVLVYAKKRSFQEDKDQTWSDPRQKITPGHRGMRNTRREKKCFTRGLNFEF